MFGQIFRQKFEKTTTPSILFEFCTKVAIGPVIIHIEGFCGASHSLDVIGDKMSGQIFRQILEKNGDPFDFAQILHKGIN